MKINQMYASNMYLANQINQNQDQMTKVDKALATGQANLEPSDYGQVAQLRTDIQVREVTQQELLNSESYLDTVEAVLEKGSKIGERLTEIATIYQSEDTTEEQKKAIYQEARELTKELKDTFTNATYNGEKIFPKNGKESISSNLQLDMPNMSFLDDLTGKLEIDKITESIATPLQQSLSNVQQLKQSYTTAIDAYKKTMDTQNTGTSATSSTMNTTTSTSYAESFLNKLVSQTLKEVFANNTDVLDYISSKSPYELYKEIAEQSYDSLKSLAEKYGYEKEFELIKELGLFDLIGIEKPEETMPPEEDTGSIPPTDTDETDTENQTGETTPGEESDVETGDGSINIGIGDNNGDIDIDIDVDLDEDTVIPPVGTVDDTTEDMEEITDETLDEFGEWFTPEYVKENVTDVLNKAEADVSIKNRILEFRMTYETRIQEIQEERLARLQEVDIAEELIKKSKLTMMKEVNAYLLHWNLTHQQRMIDILF